MNLKNIAVTLNLNSWKWNFICLDQDVTKNNLEMTANNNLIVGSDLGYIHIIGLNSKAVERVL